MGDISNLPDLLMVGDFDEFVQATHNLGWPKSNVLRTTVVHLEGRRYKSLHVTWKAFEIIQNTDALWYMMKTMDAMSSVDIVITVGKLKPPPVDHNRQYDMASPSSIARSFGRPSVEANYKGDVNLD